MWWRLIITGALFVLPLTAASQDPEIIGQEEIVTHEDEPVTIRLSDLRVRTDSWWYPWGFSLRIHDGENYDVSRDRVHPHRDFHGVLHVPVTVRERNRESDPFTLVIEVIPVNDPPVITSQQSLTTPEETPFTLTLAHLTIHDPDDNQFTLEVGDGNHYSRSGHTITPHDNFNGELRIPVRVSDGESFSKWFEAKLAVTAVNDPPVIVGQKALQSDQHKSFNIPLSHLHVEDPDNNYPGDFTLKILPSESNTYTATGHTVTPATNFAGELTVRLRVNDGQTDSEVFGFKVNVIRVNDVPRITAQRNVAIIEDTAYPITFSDLTVEDRDNTYPGDFTLALSKGDHYSFTETTVTPDKDYTGPLRVNVTVHDGYESSDTFPFLIDVMPVNDAPEITEFEEESLLFEAGTSLTLTEKIRIHDPDNDSLAQAEVSFHPQRYRPGVDELFSEDPGELIDVHFNAATGIMTLTGAAPIRAYEQQLRSIRYRRVASYTGPNESKIIYFTVSDSEAQSRRVERIIDGDDVIVDLDIPTAFTPNGDMTNDTWVIRPLKNSDKLGDAVIRVYSPSGYLLFETRGFETHWDGYLQGELLPAGSYYYTIEFNPAVSRTRFRGVVVILR